MKNILFVCSANKQRSKTAEDYFSAKYTELNFHSVGTNQKICHREGTNFITADDLMWSDHIYVMEDKHRKLIVENSFNGCNNKITVLNIPDRFKYYQEELLALLDERILF